MEWDQALTQAVPLALDVLGVKSIDEYVEKKKQSEQKTEFVYFIRAVDGGPIKIGYSIHPKKRLEEIQNMSPTPLELLATIPGDRAAEAELHQQFDEYRLYGEWFDPCDELMRLIDLAAT
jgi:hypothetical protein